MTTKQQLELAAADYWPFTTPNAIDSYKFVCLANVCANGYRQDLRFLEIDLRFWCKCCET